MPNTIVSKNLKAIRKALGYTQEEFASLFKLGRAAYAAYETGRNAPDTKALADISKGTDLSLDYIVNKEISEIDYDEDLMRYLIKTVDDPNSTILIMRKGSPMEGLTSHVFGEIEEIPENEDPIANLLFRVQSLEVDNENLKLQVKVLTQKYYQLVQSLNSILKIKKSST